MQPGGHRFDPGQLHQVQKETECESRDRCTAWPVGIRFRRDCWYGCCGFPDTHLPVADVSDDRLLDLQCPSAREFYGRKEIDLASKGREVERKSPT